MNIDPEKIPSYVTKIADELARNGYEAYLVGGSIRDIILGKEPTDYDIATNAYPDDIVRIFPKSIPVGAQFGTIVVVTEDDKGERFDVEVTTYRSEEDYFGGRWPSKVEFAKHIEDDLKRRDFTINAIALDLVGRGKKEEANIDTIDKSPKSNDSDTEKGLSSLVLSPSPLIDPFGGISDLKNKIIRAVGDPIERFSEDGLRSVRACRLAAQLEFEIHKNTFDAIKQTLHVTKQVSIERFRDELMKMLKKSSVPSKGFILMKDSGILEIFIPELLEGINVTQPEFHTDDVFLHSIKTCDYAEDSIKLAALFHDIGKSRTRTEDEKGIHFYGHDVVGADMTKQIMKRLRFSNVEIEHTVRLVRWHMFYYPSADWRKENQLTDDSLKSTNPSAGRQDYKLQASLGWSDSAIRRLIQNVGGEDAVDDLMKLRIADATANPKNDFNPKELDALSQRIADVRAKEMALKISDLDITGKDLMENFNLASGPILGEILSYLLEEVMEEPLYNKKIDLLRLAKEFLEKKK